MLFTSFHAHLAIFTAAHAITLPAPLMIFHRLLGFASCSKLAQTFAALDGTFHISLSALGHWSFTESNLNDGLTEYCSSHETKDHFNHCCLGAVPSGNCGSALCGDWVI